MVQAFRDLLELRNVFGADINRLGFPNCDRALQAGGWAAKNILADIEGRPREPFHYSDKGYMAMVGRGSAVAEVGPGPNRKLLSGPLAFLAWLGVHVVLLSGSMQKIRALATWPSDYISHRRSFVVLSRPDRAHS